MANHEIYNSFDVGRVLDRTFRAVKNNFVSFFLASILIVGVPLSLISVAPFFLDSQAVIDGGVITDETSAFVVIASIVGVVISALAGGILQGSLIYGAIADFNNQRAQLRECLLIGLKYIFPLLGISILMGLGIFLGMILLIIPGLILWMGWAVSVPVLIVENRGVTGSMSRSWDLTRGFKWWILLLFLILTIIGAVIGAVLGFLSVPLSAALAGAGEGLRTALIVNALASSVAQAISAMITASGVAAAYYEIRLVKEGVGADAIASVFD
ncbi:MAG: glycerophosphoryl diester phosphodiesterase membrane domain-containing protein [Pseudomonadota bacterium]